MKQLRVWILRVLLLVLCLGALAVGFNLLVDPFGIYQLVSIDGINANKHAAITHTRMVKPYLVDKLAPVSIVMGSSRPEVAVDPDYAAWPETYRPVYNYSFHGTSIQELAGWLDHALQVAPVQKILFGLDFHMFSKHEDASDHWQGNWFVHRQALLSLDSLIASWRTLREQDPIDDPGLLPNGQLAWTANLRRVKKHGHRRDFIHKEEAGMRNMLDRVQAGDGYIKPESLEVLDDMLNLCRRRGIEVTFFVVPVHIRLNEVFYQAGFYEEYLDWKKSLVMLLDANNRRYANRPAYPLYDFSGVNYVNTEPVPPLGDVKTNMVYYWESSHCKKQAGDMMLDVMFGRRELLPDPDFGVVLTTANVDAVLAESRQKFLDYRSQHPEMVEEISAMRTAYEARHEGL